MWLRHSSMKPLADQSRGPAMRWRRAVCFALLVAAAGLARGQGSYKPEQVAPSAHAAYVLPDGTVQIITSSRLAGVVRALDAVFQATHPGVKFQVLEGDNY